MRKEAGVSVFVRRVLGLVVACLVGGCGEEAPTEGRLPGGAESAPLSVYVVNHPLEYFATRIGGERVAVVFPAPPGVDPAGWSPDPETVAAYQQADVILLNGAGYAAWVGRASLPQRRVVDTSAAFGDRLLPLKDSIAHSHGPEGEHAHGVAAFTTWLDPELALEQARAVAEALTAARPALAPEFAARFEALAAELRALDAKLGAAARAIGEAPILFAHPVYGYLMRRYRLNGRSLHWEPDVLPDAAAWRELEALLAEHPARWMLWESPPLAETRRRLAQRGVASFVYAPSGNAPAQGDFGQVMQRNAAALASLSSGGE
jgi:zinc transport system substrate-binding protein